MVWGIRHRDNKKWAIQNNVNPILYINDNIELINTLKENLKFLLDLRDKENCINSNIQPYITNLFINVLISNLMKENNITTSKNR